jgi:hypothetical protein
MPHDIAVNPSTAMRTAGSSLIAFAVNVAPDSEPRDGERTVCCEQLAQCMVGTTSATATIRPP